MTGWPKFVDGAKITKLHLQADRAVLKSKEQKAVLEKQLCLPQPWGKLLEIFPTY